jgi:hypothetical protein
MKQISARLGVHLAGSLLLRDGQDIYNALLLYAPDGRLWRYDKNYPWAWERAYFRERRAITIAETDLGSIGLMLCWDLAHANLWRQYAGQVDLILACSCPPNLSNPVYSFPDGSQVTAAQMGPLFGRMQQTEQRVFIDTPRQQAAWLGVPFAGSTACGRLRSRLPNPIGSFLTLLPTAPWLIRLLPQVKQMEVSAALVEAAHVFAADGRELAGLYSAQGETFALAEVSLPDQRPQPHGRPPRPPVPWLAYVVSDILLRVVSLNTYGRRLRTLV